MGREIVYCEGCGQRLTEDDFTRGKAQDHEGRPFCSTCRPITEPPVPSPGDKRATERRSGTSPNVRRRGATDRVPLAQPPPSTRIVPPEGGGPGVGVYVGGGLAVLILIIVAVASTGTREPAVVPSEPVAPVVKPPAPPDR